MVNNVFFFFADAGSRRRAPGWHAVFFSADGGEAKEERLSLPRLGKMLGLRHWGGGGVVVGCLVGLVAVDAMPHWLLPAAAGGYIHITGCSADRACWRLVCVCASSAF